MKNSDLIERYIQLYLSSWVFFEQGFVAAPYVKSVNNVTNYFYF